MHLDIVPMSYLLWRSELVRRIIAALLAVDGLVCLVSHLLMTLPRRRQQ